ncbi:thiamine pyrophosphate-binding protein, partial [uncultured Akkermansia sp.]
MNSPASFVKSLLAQCCLGGICEWVVCPGARNMALLQVLAAAEDLVKWTHFDERSAAFFALGRIQDMGLPVAVVTTSGTAAAELLPAVVEAYYQRRPLLLLTADRPAACRGSAAPQAIEQADLFGIYAPTIDLETPENLPEDILQGWDYASPLHINVCLPDPDPAWNPGICDLYPAEPPEENGFRGSLAELARALRFKSRDGLVVMIGGLDPTEQAPARWLANELKAPVVADATSGLREELAHLALTDADSL